jgi:hypothetical protein
VGGGGEEKENENDKEKGKKKGIRSKGVSIASLIVKLTESLVLLSLA